VDKQEFLVHLLVGFLWVGFILTHVSH
jgi:hypothetical protein